MTIQNGHCSSHLVKILMRKLKTLCSEITIDSDSNTHSCSRQGNCHRQKGLLRQGCPRRLLPLHQQTVAPLQPERYWTQLQGRRKHIPCCGDSFWKAWCMFLAWQPPWRPPRPSRVGDLFSSSRKVHKNINILQWLVALVVVHSCCVSLFCSRGCLVLWRKQSIKESKSIDHDAGDDRNSQRYLKVVLDGATQHTGR